jgi:hypothetical protein
VDWSIILKWILEKNVIKARGRADKTAEVRVALSGM